MRSSESEKFSKDRKMGTKSSYSIFWNGAKIIGVQENSNPIGSGVFQINDSLEIMIILVSVLIMVPAEENPNPMVGVCACAVQNSRAKCIAKC